MFLLAVVVSVLAIPISPFKGWDDLIDKSPDIIIARCMATQDLLTPKPKSFFSNVFSSDIEVISVLKGNTMPGPSHMTSLYFPYRGEYFLVFASSFQYETDLVYGPRKNIG